MNIQFGIRNNMLDHPKGMSAKMAANEIRTSGVTDGGRGSKFPPGSLDVTPF